MTGHLLRIDCLLFAISFVIVAKQSKIKKKKQTVYCSRFEQKRIAFDMIMIKRDYSLSSFNEKMFECDHFIGIYLYFLH